jgi:hypothetical protein
MKNSRSDNLAKHKTETIKIPKGEFNILKYRSEYRRSEISRLENLEKTKGLSFSEKGTLATLRALVKPIKQP